MPPNRPVVRSGVDGDRPEARNGWAFVQEVTPDDVAIQLGDDGIKAGMHLSRTMRATAASEEA